MNLDRITSAIALKLLVGVALITTIIVTIYYFISALNSYFEQINSGMLLRLITFGALILLSTFCMYFVFKKNHNINSDADKEKNLDIKSAIQIGIISIILGFAQGFLNGYGAANQRRRLTLPRP